MERAGSNCFASFDDNQNEILTEEKDQMILIEMMHVLKKIFYLRKQNYFYLHFEL